MLYYTTLIWHSSSNSRWFVDRYRIHTKQITRTIDFTLYIKLDQTKLRLEKSVRKKIRASKNLINAWKQD